MASPTVEIMELPEGVVALIVTRPVTDGHHARLT